MSQMQIGARPLDTGVQSAGTPEAPVQLKSTELAAQQTAGPDKLRPVSSALTELDSSGGSFARTEAALATGARLSGFKPGLAAPLDRSSVDNPEALRLLRAEKQITRPRGDLSRQDYQSRLNSFLTEQVSPEARALKDSVASGMLLQPFMNALAMEFSGTDAYDGAGLEKAQAAAKTAGDLAGLLDTAATSENAASLREARQSLRALADTQIDRAANPESRAKMSIALDAMLEALDTRLATLEKLEAGASSFQRQLAEFTANPTGRNYTGLQKELAAVENQPGQGSRPIFSRIQSLNQLYSRAAQAALTGTGQLLNHYLSGTEERLDKPSALLQSVGESSAALQSRLNAGEYNALAADFSLADAEISLLLEHGRQAASLLAQGDALLAQGLDSPQSMRDALKFLDEAEQTAQKTFALSPRSRAQLMDKAAAVKTAVNAARDKFETETLARVNILTEGDNPAEIKALMDSARNDPRCDTHLAYTLQNIWDSALGRHNAALLKPFKQALAEGEHAVKRGISPDGLSGLDRLEQEKHLQAAENSLYARLDSLTREAETLQRQTDPAAKARLEVIRADLELLKPLSAELKNTETRLILSKYEKAAAQRGSVDISTQRELAPLAAKLAQATLPAAELDAARRGAADGSLTPENRTTLAEKLDIFLTGKQKADPAVRLALNTLKDAGKPLAGSAEVRATLAALVAFIPGAEAARTLEAALRTGSAQTLQALNTQLDSLGQVRDETALRNLGGRLANLQNLAARTLLPDDFTKFQTKLDALLNTKAGELIALTAKSAGSEARLAALSPEDKQTLRRLALASTLSPRLLELALGQDNPAAFLRSLAHGSRHDAAEKMEKLLLPHPEMDDLCLLLKQDVREGRFHGAPGEALAPAEKTRLANGHVSARLVRECKSMLRQQSSIFSSGTEKARLESLLAAGEGKFLRRMTAGLDGGAHKEMDLLLLQASWLHESAGSSPKTFAAFQAALPEPYKSDSALETTLGQGLASSAAQRQSQALTQSITGQFSGAGLFNRALNFAGFLLGRPLSSSALAAKALVEVSMPPGHMDAKAISNGILRDRLDFSSGTGIGGDNLMLALLQTVHAPGMLDSMRNGVAGIFKRDLAPTVEGQLNAAARAAASMQADQSSLQRLGAAREEALEQLMDKYGEVLLDMHKARNPSGVSREVLRTPLDGGATLALGVEAIGLVLPKAVAAADADWQAQQALLNNVTLQSKINLSAMKGHALLGGSAGDDPTQITGSDGTQRAVSREFTRLLDILKTTRSRQEFTTAAGALQNLYAEQKLQQKAEAVLVFKESTAGPAGLSGKIDDVLGKDSSARGSQTADLKSALREKYAVLFGAAEKMLSYVESMDKTVGKQLALPRDSMSYHLSALLDEAAELAVLQTFMEHGAEMSFADFAKDINNPDSDNHARCTERLSAVLQKMRPPALPGTESAASTPASAGAYLAKADADALGSYLTTRLALKVENFKEGAEAYLQQRSEDFRQVDHEMLTRLSFGEESRQAFRAVHMEATVDGVFARLPGNSALSLDLSAGAGIKVSASPFGEGLTLGASLGVSLERGLLLEKDSAGNFKLYLGSKTEVKGSISAEAELLSGFVDASAELGVSGAVGKGVQVTFADEADCKKFISNLMSGGAGLNSLLLCQSVAPVYEYGGGVSLGVEIKLGSSGLEEQLGKIKALASEEVSGALTPAARKANETDAAKGEEAGEEEDADSLDLFEVKLALGLAASGGHKVEQSGIQRVVTDSLQASAAIALSGEVKSGQSGELAGAAAFDARLQSTYTGNVLTGAEMVRTFKLAPSGDMTKDMREAGQLLTGHGVRNPALLAALRELLESGQSVELGLTQKITESGLANYRAAGNAFTKMLCLTDRKNYEPNEVSVAVNAGGQRLARSLEKSQEEILGDILPAPIDVTLDVSISAESKIQRNYLFTPGLAA
jgi:hypothetical protein